MPDYEWKNKKFAFFANKECEFFPCHEGIPEDEFNCLFCYCPLYFTGKSCGGGCTFTANGVKDCSACLIPHRRDNYGYIVDKFTELANSGKE